MIIFLKKMDLLLAKTPKDDVRDHVLPMVCKALETPAEQLQVIILVNKFVEVLFLQLLKTNRTPWKESRREEVYPQTKS